MGLDSQGSLQSNVCCLGVFRDAFGFEGSLGSHGECSEPWSFHDRTDAHASLKTLSVATQRGSLATLVAVTGDRGRGVDS